MNKKLVALSFFKSKKINYYLYGSSIIFPCFNCQHEAIMDCQSTLWECKNCSENGTLKYLIEFTQTKSLESIKKYKVYNPRKTRKEINSKFQILINKCDENIKNDLENLYKQTEELFVYFFEKINN
jgi:hypothetical protein